MVGDMESAAADAISNDGHVLVALLERRLVDADMDQIRSARRARPSNGSLHDAVDLVPCETQLPCDGLDVGLLQSTNHHRLHQRREARPSIRPRHIGLDDTMFLMFLACDPGYVSVEDRLELAGVQVAPGSSPSVVALAYPLARGADTSSAVLQPNQHSNFLVLLVELDAFNMPGGLDPEDPGVEVHVAHPVKVPPASAGLRQPLPGATAGRGSRLPLPAAAARHSSPTLFPDAPNSLNPSSALTRGLLILNPESG
jgi:hypothetical protein